MSIIIFDGVDNCGKTEISHAVVERLLPDHQYFKVKQERIHVEKVDPAILKVSHELQLNFFYELARQAKLNIVMDRFYPSEYVYGSLFRQINEDLIWEFDAKFAELGVKIIIPHKGDAFLEDELWTKEQLIQVREKYKEFAEKSKCDVLLLNTEDENLDRELADIAAFLNHD